MKSLDEQIKSLHELEFNWDSYGSKPIARPALAVLESLHFSPLSDGGVQIEFHLHGHNVEIVISPEGEPEGFNWERYDGDDPGPSD